MNQKGLVDSLIEEGFFYLPEGKNPVGGLNDIGIEDLRKSKKLPAFKGRLK